MFTFNDHSLLQSDIDSLSRWNETWKIFLNVSKCVGINFCLSPSQCPNEIYKVGSNTIDFVNIYKDLGIIVRNDLSWSSHYQYICSKAYKSLFLIKKSISSSSSSNLRKTLYLSLVHCHLTYCSQLWGGCNMPKTF